MKGVIRKALRHAENCWALYVDGTHFNIQRRGSTVSSEAKITLVLPVVSRHAGFQ